MHPADAQQLLLLRLDMLTVSKTANGAEILIHVGIYKYQ